MLHSLDAETAHMVALKSLQLASWLASPEGFDDPTEVAGIRLRNKVGIAAGFDKDGIAIDGLARLGFGFIEVGAVTPRPQSGKPRPRIFRSTRHRAIINGMGFPNAGVHALSRRLQAFRPKGVPIGVNVGPNAETPQEEWVTDYESCMRLLDSCVDFLTINVSSPNTTALRDFGTGEQLSSLLRRLVQVRNSVSHGEKKTPLLVKISPDQDENVLATTIHIIEESGCDGIVATNTTVERYEDLDRQFASKSGGLSGNPLFMRACEVVAYTRKTLTSDLPIIGVGGIDSADRARRMLDAGANAVSLYTGLVFKGPGLIPDLVRATQTAPKSG